MGAGHASQLHVVYLERANARSPGGTLQQERNAHLLGRGLRREVGRVSLVRVARNGKVHAVAVVLEVLDADRAQLLAVRADAALRKARERVYLVGRNVDDLRDLGCRPAAFPHVAVNLQHVVVLVDLVRALLGADALRRVPLVVGINVPALDAVRDAGARVVV